MTFKIICTKCNSEDIELEIESDFPEPDTMHYVKITCNNCENTKTYNEY